MEVGGTHHRVQCLAIRRRHRQVAEFAEGLALTGSYWIDDFGEAASYHNVAMAPVDARWVWTWSDPPIPEGWNGAVIDEQTPTTIVYVHR